MNKSGRTFPGRAENLSAMHRSVSMMRDGDRVLVKSSNSAGLRFLGDRLGDDRSGAWKVPDLSPRSF